MFSALVKKCQSFLSTPESSINLGSIEFDLDRPSLRARPDLGVRISPEIDYLSLSSTFFSSTAGSIFFRIDLIDGQSKHTGIITPSELHELLTRIDTQALAIGYVKDFPSFSNYNSEVANSPESLLINSGKTVCLSNFSDQYLSSKRAECLSYLSDLPNQSECYLWFDDRRISPAELASEVRGSTELGRKFLVAYLSTLEF